MVGTVGPDAKSSTSTSNSSNRKTAKPNAVDLDQYKEIDPSQSNDPPFQESAADPQKLRRFAIKLRLLGNNSGLFLLLGIAGTLAFVLLGIIPRYISIFGWLIPQLLATGILTSVYVFRRHQYKTPNIFWYLSLLIALFLSGIAWAAFLVEILLLIDPARQFAGILIFVISIFISGLLLSIDLTIISVFLISICITLMFNLTITGLNIHMSLLFMVGIAIATESIVFFWHFRQQRMFVRVLAELGILRVYYKTTQLELAHLRDQLEVQIQQQKNVETEIKQAKEAAEIASIAKTEFLATMSHEIRTPLNGMLPILEMLRGTELDSTQSDYVNTALNSSNHLLSLINDILDYTKIEAGKLALEIIDVNLSELVGSVISLMSKSAERRNIRLNSKISAAIPRQVRGDPLRLRQVLTNLVGNAIKFTEKGTILVEVKPHATSSKEIAIFFAVRDTGVGMTKESVGQLFQVFAQADASTTRRYGGTGLGLAICKRTVEIMGGHIGVKSELGKGSTFWFIVPMRKALDEVPSARQNLHGVKVLLTGFDVDETRRIVGHFNEWGMLSEHSANIPDTMNKLKSMAKLGTTWGYDVLIVNAQMGIVALTGMMQDISKIFELSTLIVIAVDTFKSVVTQLKEIGIAEIIPKAIQEQELSNRLHRLLDVQTYRSSKPQSEHRQPLMPDAAYSWEDGQYSRSVGLGVQSTSQSSTATKKTTKTLLANDSPLVGQVLVVEDNPVNLTVIKKLLQHFGLTCDIANDGQEGLNAVKNSQYDLVLMDMQMPKMDGYQATALIRAREKELGLARLPILAMTANAMSGDREKCINAGTDDYISKPVKPADLKNLLRQWLPMQETVSKAHIALEQPPITETPKPIEQPNTNALRNSPAVPVPVATTSGTETNSTNAEQDSTLDYEILGGLFEYMMQDTIGLIQLYLDNVPVLFKDIERAVQENNAEMLVLPAHSLKSSSANVGAMHVSTIARKLEFIGKEKKMVEAKHYWEAIQVAYAQAEQKLQAIIARGGL